MSLGLPERLESKISPEPNSGCWLWDGNWSGSGYGRVKIAKTRRCAQAHTMVYELLVAPVPTGLVLDHLCRNRCCVNPEHLEPVTEQVNILRGTGQSARNARKTVCPQGHPLVDVYRVGNTRKCRVCQKAKMREQYLKKKGA